MRLQLKLMALGFEKPPAYLCNVTEEEKRLTLRWIETWRRAGPELERIRHEEIRQTNTLRAMKMFEGLVAENLRRRPVRLTSGLVEQQAIFHRKKA